MAPPTGSEFRSREDAERAIADAEAVRDKSLANVQPIIERSIRAHQFLASLPRQQPTGPGPSRKFPATSMRQRRQGRKPAPADPYDPPVYEKHPPVQPTPMWEYAAEDLSTDRGRLDPSDPRIVETNRREKVRAEGKALADADALTARRSGQLRRARERPMSQGGGLYSLLTGGRHEDRDYYGSARDRMMNVYDEEEGDLLATRTRPGADVGMSPGGRYVDLRERRVPEAIRRRREKLEREGPPSTLDVIDPATGKPKEAGFSIKKLREGTRIGRDAMRARMKAERDAASDNLRRERAAYGQPQAGGGITGFGDVPQVPQEAHPFASWTPQMRAMHQARLMGNHGSVAQEAALGLQRGADSHQSARQAGTTGRYRATQAAHQAAAGEGEPDQPGTVTAEDRAGFYNMQDPTQTGDAAQRSRAIAEIWNSLHRSKGSDVSRYNEDAFVQHVIADDPQRWSGKQDEIRRWWRLVREKFQGTEYTEDDPFSEDDKPWFFGKDLDEHQIALPMGGQPPPGSAGGGGVPGVTSPAKRWIGPIIPRGD